MYISSYSFHYFFLNDLKALNMNITKTKEKKTKCATWINLMQVQAKMISTKSEDHLHMFMALQFEVIFEYFHYGSSTAFKIV